ncbi:MAG: MFS transporter [Alphaproteobacteria bacterium]|nr:MFS transporter [Alphaproteobacteria bacterium]
MKKSNETKGSQAGLWLILLVTIAVQALATFTTLSLAAIAPDVASGLSVSPELVGFQVSLIYFGGAVMSTVAGFQLRRWGPVRVSQASLMFCAVGAGLAVIPSLATVAAGSIVIGFGYGMTNPAASELLLRIMPAGRRNLIFSIKQTGVPIGGVLAGLTAPPISQSFGWQWAPAVAAISCFMLALLIQPLRTAWDADRDPTARFKERPFDALSIVWRSPPLRWLSVSGFFYAAVQLSLATFVVTLLVTDAGFGLIEAGAVLAIVQAAGVVGRVAWGWIADRLGHGLIVLLIIGGACVTGALLVMAVSETWSTFAILILFTLFGINALGWTGVFQVEAARYAPQGKLGTVIGGVTAPTYGGVIVGPAVFSLAFVAIGSYTTTFALVALFAVLGMLSVALASRAAARNPSVSAQF